MATARVLTKWVEGVGGRPRWAQLGVVFPQLAWREAARIDGRLMPPSPNLCLVEVECTAAELAAIDADPRFKVVYDDLTRSQAATPQVAEFGQLRAWLASNGVQPPDLDAVVGANVGGRRRGVIERRLAGWVRGRPRA